MSKLMEHRKTAFMLLFVVLAIGFLESQDSSKSKAITTDEYAVYAAAMDNVVGGMRYWKDQRKVGGDQQDTRLDIVDGHSRHRRPERANLN